MDVGAMDTPVDRLPGDARPLVELYDEGIRNMVEDETRGFDFVTADEHHFLEAQWNPSPLMILTAVAARTSRVRLGTNVLLTPLYQPIRLAEDLATLDLISQGRANVVFGSGSTPFEFDTLGIPGEERFGRVWETLDIIRRSFSEEEFDFHGTHFDFPHIRQTTKPVQNPFPIWYGGFSPTMFARAGREGYHVLGALINPWDKFLEAAQKAGRTLDQINMGVSVTISMVTKAEDVAAAEAAIVAERDATAVRYRKEGRGAWGTASPSTVQRRSGQNPNTVAIGTPDMVLRELEPQLIRSNFTHFLARGPGMRSPLFVKEVMPTLKSWGRQPVLGTGAMP